MGCGQKYWAEELEQAAHKKFVEKCSQKDIVEVMTSVEYAKALLRRFVDSDPTLTKSQWNTIDEVSRIIDGVLK